jgi:hypothetical protein
MCLNAELALASRHLSPRLRFSLLYPLCYRARGLVASATLVDLITGSGAGGAASAAGIFVAKIKQTSPSAVFASKKDSGKSFQAHVEQCFAISPDHANALPFALQLIEKLKADDQQAIRAGYSGADASATAFQLNDDCSKLISKVLKIFCLFLNPEIRDLLGGEKAALEGQPFSSALADAHKNYCSVADVTLTTEFVKTARTSTSCVCWHL